MKAMNFSFPPGSEPDQIIPAISDPLSAIAPAPEMEHIISEKKPKAKKPKSKARVEQHSSLL
jgi:hypothetical protein